MMSRRAEATGSTSRAAQARDPGPEIVPRSREHESSPKGQGPRFGTSPSADGRILPLGASWSEEEHAYNFSLYAQHAENVVLLLFSENELASPFLEYRLGPRVNKTWNIWHCRVAAEAESACYYAYRIDGPRSGESGNRHDGRAPARPAVRPAGRQLLGLHDVELLRAA